jgi:hypothetical protein
MCNKEAQELKILLVFLASHGVLLTYFYAFIISILHSFTPYLFPSWILSSWGSSYTLLLFYSYSLSLSFTLSFLLGKKVQKDQKSERVKD